MKKRILVLISLTAISWGIISASNAGESQGDKSIIYSSNYSSQNINAVIFINGIYVDTIERSTSGVSVISTYLIKKNNKLKIECRKFDKNKEASFLFNIAKQTKGDIVDSRDTGKTIIKFNNSDLAKNKVATKEITFDSECNYGQSLLSGEKIEEKEVLKYGLYLIKLFQKNDYDKIIENFKPKLLDLSKIHNMDYDKLVPMIREQIAADYGKNTLLPVKKASELKAISDEKKIVWYIGKKNGDALIKTKMNKDGMSSSFEIWVKKVDGKIRIIR